VRELRLPAVGRVARLASARKLRVMLDPRVGLLVVGLVAIEAGFAGAFELTGFAPVASETIRFGVSAFQWPRVLQSRRAPGCARVTRGAGGGTHPRVRRVLDVRRLIVCDVTGGALHGEPVVARHGARFATEYQRVAKHGRAQDSQTRQPARRVAAHGSARVLSLDSTEHVLVFKVTDPAARRKQSCRTTRVRVATSVPSAPILTSAPIVRGCPRGSRDCGVFCFHAPQKGLADDQ